MKEELLKLAERVEALSGPDREVDARIWCALNGKKYVSHWREYDGPNTRVEYIEPPKRTPFASSTVALQWTASLDAAMTLVPKTMSLVDLTLSWEPPEPEVFPACSITWYPAAVIHNGKDWHALTASGATPALALTAAALRALAKEDS